MPSFRFFSIICLVCFFTGTLFASPPPEEIEKKNLEANLILIGTVERIGKILLLDEKPPPKRFETATEPSSEKKQLRGMFILKALHVVKGRKKVSPGDEVKIVYRLPEEAPRGISSQVSGILPVKVESKDLVVIFIDPTANAAFYQPVAGGASVVVIGPFAALAGNTDKKIKPVNPKMGNIGNN
ncbi:hypothetical protein DSCA_20240 [Desulfosarcina alkanivorans]|uniref:DUF5666 domain-containing protein n=1 Tax=Desulfosarcina alkanivorans TaxID=571177 RepID=A0A5K7YP06_9BACT|nr:hypothetical protein [Desulfosarcina alkanivorans]BBO68094.1 hypothetical protein DSCA_20240 [Desulfosarcina alkanivorans]